MEAKPLFGERCLATQTLPEFRREARKKVCFRSENSHYRDEHLCLESRCCDDKQASKVKNNPFSSVYGRAVKEVRMFVSYFSARCESGLGVLNDIGTLEAAAAPAMNMQKTRGVGKEKSNNARKLPNILPVCTTKLGRYTDLFKGIL